MVHITALARTARGLLLPQLKYLRDQGYRVTVAAAPGPEASDLEAAGISFLDLPMDRRIATGANALAPLRAARLLRSAKADIVHVHTPVAAALARLGARLARTPLVFYTAHGFYFHDLMPAPQRRAHLLLEKALGNLTDHLFTQSGEDYDTALREGISTPANTTYLGNGVDVEHFAGRRREARSAMRRRLGFADDDVVVAFVGRFVAEKGIYELLEAAASLLEAEPDLPLRLLLIGGALPSDRLGRESAPSRLEELLAHPRLGPATVNAGRVPTVADHLAAADVFCLPSHREGMPRSVIEAMAAALPVVATNIRGCREEVVDGRTGILVPPGDSRRLATALHQLIRRPEARLRLGGAGQERARLHYDERLVFGRLLEVYRRYAPPSP